MFIDLVTNSNVETLPIDANYICTMLDNFIFDSEGRLETLNSLNGFIKAYVGYNNACNIIKQHNITMAELDASYIM